MTNKQIMLDLDALVQDDLDIKLNGKIYKAKSLTVKQIIKLQKEFLKIQDNPQDISVVKDLIKEILPALEKDEVDLNVPQMQALIEFIITHTMGEVNKASTDTEKKILQ